MTRERKDIVKDATPTVGIVRVVWKLTVLNAILVVV